MPVVLNATPGDPDANSFTTLAFADEYHLGQIFSDGDWENLDEDVKNRGLITATRLITNAVRSWAGYMIDPSQALPFPRSGVYQRIYDYGVYPTNVVPLELQQATAEYARILANAKKMPDTPSDTVGIKELKAGSVGLVFDGTYKAPTGLPQSILDMISFLFGEAGGASSLNIPAYRT